MVTIVTRAGKGYPLTHNEVDANFNNLSSGVDAAAAAAAAAAQQAALYNPASVTITSLRSNNAVAALGDSITINSSGGVGTYFLMGERSWPQHAASQSGRKFFVSQIAGGGGYRTDQIIAGILPGILNKIDGATGAPTVKPGYCAVLAGTNDLAQGVPNATVIGNLRIIYDRLLTAGIVPVACALTPRADIVNSVMKFNWSLQELARQYSIPFADFWTACADSTTGGWLAGYNADTIHPNGVGAQAMGTELARALSFMTPRTIPVGYQNNNIMWANSLFLTDSNADGIPDGWGYDFLPSNATNAIITDSAVAGKAWQITSTGTGAVFAARGPSSFATTPGNWVAFCFRYNFVPAGTSPALNVLLRKQPFNGGDVLGGLQWGTTPVPSTNGWVDYYQMFRVPAGVSSIYAEIGVGGIGSVLKLGQFGIVDLTANGITPV